VLVRKTVTVLFSDVAEFTGLGEQLDPESLRRLMSRYFEEMRRVVERHGGTIEKFIGDEIMAVFGVPQIHEDDALRAIRAASEMRAALDPLNDELEQRWGVRLRTRTGVNTGEVVAEDPADGSSFVTGDTVNLAKRLEQAAGAGEILIGKATYPLVRDAVTAGPLQSFPVKGKSEPVSPLRLDEVEARAPGLLRRLDAPLVDRTLELAALQEAFARAEHTRELQLVTVLGPAGIGKSRLVAELVASVADRAQTFTGPCLPYGEGITFWPIVQILRQAGGNEGIAEALGGVEGGELVLERLDGLLGTTPSASAEETFWAIRRFLEALAHRSPLVIVLEDIHWAEPTLLDLIEYLGGWTRDAPILVICLARRDLLERQPGWVTPRRNAFVVTLEALGGPDVDELLDELGSESALPQGTLERIAAAAEGNPLFLEQLVAMASENGGNEAELRVPPSIQALLAARLDRLSADERAVIECAAVVGREFLRGEVVDLASEELRPGVGSSLMALVRKELIRPDTAATARDDGFRFRHALIRDAAYDGMPKEVRAELHERFAGIVEVTYPDRLTELEEIVGYHLERAHTLRTELGREDAVTEALAVAAGERLTRAGRRAFSRGDAPAAVNLLQRATALLDAAGGPDADVLLDLGAALREAGDTTGADSAFTRAAAAAEAAGDEALGLRVLIERTMLGLYVDPDAQARELIEVAETATRVFEEKGDTLGLARAWSLAAEAQWIGLQCSAMEAMLERALGYAERAGGRHEMSWILSSMARAALIGPRHVEDGVRRCHELRTRARSEPMVVPVIDSLLAVLEAMRGRFEEARTRYASSRAALDTLGLRLRFAQLAMYAGMVELLAGDPEEAERQLRPACDQLEEMSELGVLSTTAGVLARAVYEQRRFDEALRLTEISERAASPADIVTQVFWRGMRARVLASRGQAEEAQTLALHAVELARQTDFVNMLADALVDLAETLLLLGRGGKARVPLTEAISLYAAKGNVVSAAAARARLDQVSKESETSR
jgi:class 3 adenylate cyclase/tetratricopeptide (TPR) repeat protein